MQYFSGLPAIWLGRSRKSVSNCRANRGRERAGRRKKALCTAYGSLVVPPQFRSMLRRKQLARFVNSIWIISGRRGACLVETIHIFSWTLAPGWSLSYSIAASIGPSYEETRGRMSVYMFHAHFRSSRRNNTVSSHTATPSPSIGTPLSVLAVLAASKFTQRRVSRFWECCNSFIDAAASSFVRC